MRRIGTTLFCLLVVGLFLTDTAVWAQQVYVAQDIKHDTSRPMRDILRDLPPATFTNSPYAVPNRFEPFGERKGRLGEGPNTPDALLQETNGPLMTTPIVNVQGLSEVDNAATVGFAVVPPDVNGDVGVDYYVQYINSIWAVYQKSDGALFSGPSRGNSFWNGFGGFCETNNDGDPIVLYDHLAGRWVFSQFSINQGTQCVAVSTTGDPLGPYHRYAFVVTPGGANDYPKMGLFTDGAGQSAYTFTTRDFGGAGGSFSVGAGVFERDAMLTGASASFVKFINPCVVGNCIEGQLPPHLEGPPPPAGTCPTYFSYVDAAYDDSPFGSDGARNHTLCVDWNNTANSTYIENSLAVGGNFDRFLGNGFSDCISPVFGGEVLDCLAAFTMYRAQYRWWNTYASVVLNTTVDAGADRAGIRWGELRSTDGESGWGFHQEGTFAPTDGNERWMGSIAMNGNGDIALGYSVAGGSLFPSVRAAGQTAGGSLGVFDVAEFSIHEGTGAQTGSSNRWGDYSSLSVDPVDNQTFWYTQEYYGTTSSFNFKTRIASFQLGTTPGNNPPVASFTFTTNNLTVDFTDTSTDSDGTIVSWAWDFFDGNASAAQNPSHTYAVAGTYTVCLTVTDDDGASSVPACQAVTVSDGAGPTLHVSNLQLQRQKSGRLFKGKATVTVVDENGNAFQGATVTGTFSGPINESGSGNTNRRGKAVIISTGTFPKNQFPNLAFCVDDIVAVGFNYDPSANGNPSWDCGTSGSKRGTDAVTVAGETPDGFALDQNYPNPFNPSTVVAYSLAEAGPVTLKVYNVLGQEVATLVDGHKESGRHQVAFDASRLSAGVYLYVIRADGFTATKRMTLLK